MDTAPLKSFATSARTELIREVTARIKTVFIQSSPERVEEPRTVAALERAIAAAGGGEKGKSHVVDRVAYTWFNRIIALRFMDANGYTGIKVVSPAADQVGQPEVLAAAKRGQVDTGIVSKSSNLLTITALLDGTRQPRHGTDAEAEAYAMLLTDYCRFWNKAMPFMFEREGDFTELLIPANMLAEDSVLNRAVDTLTTDVCQNVEVIGWLYQFYIAERKDEVFAGFKKDRKAGPDEIPAATQLFTPHWIVRYLVENSLGRLWMLNRPDSALANQMDYYIVPANEEADYLEIVKPEELKVIDPACGSGHMLTYAFDLLYAIYAEEGYAPSQIPGLILANNLYGTEIDPRAGALAAFALTMKARAKQRTFFNAQVQPSICAIEPISFSAEEIDFLVTEDGDKRAEEAFWNQFAEADTFGSLIQPDPALTIRLARHSAALDDGGDLLRAHALDSANLAITQAKYLVDQYAVVVANPPYMGSGNMGGRLAAFMQHAFPGAKADIYGGFILRSRSLQRDLGFTAMIVGDSWLFIKGFVGMRNWVLDNFSISSLLHLQDNSKHSDIFGANAAFVSSGRDLTRDGVPTTFFHLSAQGNEAKRQIFREALRGHRNEIVSVVKTAEFKKLPLSAFAYSLPPHLCDLFNGARVKSIAHVHRGISTGNNDLYMRMWFEVSHETINYHAKSAIDTSRHRWYPVNRGSFPSRWFGYGPEVLDYRDKGHAMTAAAAAGTNPGFRHDGSSQYFKETITWSAMAAASPEFRILPSGFVLGHKGAGIDVDDDARKWLLGLLNSAPATEILRRISGTIDVLVGQIQELPLPQNSDRKRIVELVSWLIEHHRHRFAQYEEVVEFQQHPFVCNRDTNESLRNTAAEWHRRQIHLARQVRQSEQEIDLLFSKAYELPPMGDRAEKIPTSEDQVPRLISFGVGCMLGRFSLGSPGLVVAHQGAAMEDYFGKHCTPTFMPDTDNVIPIVEGDWFEDDIVERYRHFLRAAFGERHFEDNLRFVTESLGVKTLRDYFVTRAGRSKFYDDHVQRYKKRPIYWMFSSPKGSFNALIYMHRYTPSTVSTVLTYLREYLTKLESSLQQAERDQNAKETDRLRKILIELNEYEHDTLYPKASENVAIDLDDGVKANYPKLGGALRKIAGLESSIG